MCKVVAKYPTTIVVLLSAIVLGCGLSAEQTALKQGLEAAKKKDSAEAIRCISEAHRLLYRARVGLAHATEILQSNNQIVPEVAALLAFVEYQQNGRHGRGRDRRRSVE